MGKYTLAIWYCPWGSTVYTVKGIKNSWNNGKSHQKRPITLYLETLSRKSIFWRFAIALQGQQFPFAVSVTDKRLLEKPSDVSRNYVNLGKSNPSRKVGITLKNPAQAAAAGIITKPYSLRQPTSPIVLYPRCYKLCMRLLLSIIPYSGSPQADVQTVHCTKRGQILGTAVAAKGIQYPKHRLFITYFGFLLLFLRIKNLLSHCN